MPLISTRGAASAQGFGEFAQSGPVNYIEDVFSTYLYTGNGSTQTITNGIDLAGKGGLVWIKNRSRAGMSHELFDSARVITSSLRSDTTGAATFIPSDRLTGFGASGFNLGADSSAWTVNNSGDTYASWTFRKQAKFFDIVTFTAPAVGVTTTVSHSLGSTPGCIIMKSTTNTANWVVLHRYDQTMFGELNTTAAFQSAGFNANFTTTSFDVKGGFNITANSGTYIAYIFAHNAGGFGLSGTDNVISCGSFTADGSGNADVTLGYEPQWLLVKAASEGSSWSLADIMRGMPVSGNGSRLFAQSSSAESLNSWWKPNATGFTSQGLYGAGATVVYIAIRRGPMKVPTSGTSVFAPVVSNAADGTQLTAGFPVDMQMFRYREGSVNTFAVDRLRGVGTTTTTVSTPQLRTNLTDAETNTNGIATNWNNTGFAMPSGFGTVNDVFWNFRRAPGFFDVVCYTGTGANLTLNHNLGIPPELIIFKSRNTVINWRVAYGFAISTFGSLILNLDSAGPSNVAYGTTISAQPTATTFSVGSSTNVGASGGTYVAYLFATVAGVSKVGSYTGNGTTQTINCGFTAGARFVMIKRTDLQGDWYVWDSARGIVAGNDPYLRLNSTAAENTSTDSVDTDSTGFVVNELAATNINVSSATYIYFSVA